MKRFWTFFFLFSTAILSFQCSSKRALEGEKQLLWQGGAEQWWLANSVSQNEKGEWLHFNMLLSLTKTDSGQNATAYISNYNVNHGQFDFAILNEKCIVKNKMDHFPLLISSISSESTAEWRIFLDRNHFWLQFPENAKMNQKGKLNKVKSFSTQEMQANPAIWTTDLRKISYNKGQKQDVNGHFSLSGFEKASYLMAPEGYTIWLDILDTNGVRIWALIQSSDVEPYAVQGIYANREGVIQRDAKFSPRVDMGPSRWISTKSNKLYPHNFKLYLSANHSLDIQALLKNQEIEQGRNSFWMGGITANSPERNTFHRGNMLIFKR